MVLLISERLRKQLSAPAEQTGKINAMPTGIPHPMPVGIPHLS